jgi:hypothetical protein
MLNGHCLEQALHVADRLGLADLLAAGPMNADGLAQEVKADPTSMLRLLRARASVGVFEEEPDGRFALTPLGATLRTYAPGSVRDRALYYGSSVMWRVWGGLLHSVQTGEPPAGTSMACPSTSTSCATPRSATHSTATWQRPPSGTQRR